LQKTKIVTNCTFLGAAKIVTSKIIAKIIEKYYGFCGRANSRNKFFKLILKNHTILCDSVMKRHLCPCCSLVRRAGAILPSFQRSMASLILLMMLLCKGTCAPVPPFKGQGAVSPSFTSIPASLAITLS